MKDKGGLTGTTTRQVTVAPVVVNTAPTAIFSVSPTTGTTATAFQCDAAGCSDAETSSASLEVRWDWTNDGTWDTGFTTTKTANHIYPAAGTYTIKLEVQDDGGKTTSAARQVTVAAAPLPTIASFSATPAIITTGLQVTLSYTFAGGSGSISPGVGNVANGGNQQSQPSHRYNLYPDRDQF